MTGVYRTILMAGAALLVSTGAHAETLREALTKAYETNPTLNAARSGQKANDENVPITRARGLPGLDLSGSYTENVQTSSTSTPARQLGARLSFDVPLYLGGAVKNSVRAANARVESGQATLRDTEATVFSAVVGAYMDVLRDEAILGLNDKQVAVLSTNLEATRDRFEVGDLTRTDIAQSESRLAIAVSQQESGRAQLTASKERYIELVGTAPGALEQPPLLPNLPTSPETAATMALDQTCHSPGMRLFCSGPSTSSCFQTGQS